MKRFIFITALALITACETKIDFDRVDAQEHIYVNALIGNGPVSAVNGTVVVPMNSDDYSPCQKEITLSITVNGRQAEFVRDDGDIYTQEGPMTGTLAHEISPGDIIRLDASASGVPAVTATTTVPEAIRLKSAGIVSREGSFITFKVVYEEDEDDQGYYGIRFDDTDISEAPGKVLAESYDMIVSYSMLGEVMIWDRHKAVKNGNTVTFTSSVDIRNYSDRKSFLVTLFRFSPETFFHLRGLYMKSAELPSIGMGTPAFTYSNVIGGTGVVGSWWGTGTTLTKDE